MQCTDILSITCTFNIIFAANTLSYNHLTPLFPHVYRLPDISPFLPSLSLPLPYLLPSLPQGWNYRKRHLIVYCAVMGNYGQHIMGEPHLRPLRLSALVIPRWIAAIPWRRLEVSTTIIWQRSVVFCVVSF